MARKKSETWGQRYKKRLDRGGFRLTQAEICRRTGIKKHSLSRWLSGHAGYPEPRQAELMCELVGATVAEIFGDTPGMIGRIAEQELGRVRPATRRGRRRAGG